MYKVFIDHKPVIFGVFEELSTNFKRVKLSDFDLFFSEVAALMFDINIDQPLLVEIEKDEDFSTLFSEHELVEAAGGVVKSEAGYLTIERNGLWDLPKGKIEEGENTETCAVREVEEECGIIAPIIESHLVDTFHTYDYNGKAVLKKTYWYKMNYSGAEKLAPQIEEGITQVEWKSLDELLAIRGNTFGSINEVLDKLTNN